MGYTTNQHISNVWIGQYIEQASSFFYKFNSWPDLILMVGVDRLDFRPSKYVPK